MQISSSFKQETWRNFFVLVSLLACAGHDGQKAHLHVTAEVQSDIGGSILEGKKGEIALVKEET